MMKIIYLGSDSIGLPCLRELAAGPHEVLAVVTQPDRRAGRGRRMQPTPIKKLAQSLALKVYAIEDVNEGGFLKEIAGLQPGLLVVFAFNQKLGKALLQTAAHGAINVHPSLLPKYRGAAPVARAILNGESETGLSIIQMVEDLDAGDVFVQERWPIGPAETTGQVEEKLGQRAGPLLAELVEEIEKGTAKSWPQDHAKATGAPKMAKSEGLLDFALPADELVNHIRAFTPWPGAFGFYHGRTRGTAERVVIRRAVSGRRGASAAAVVPGTVLQDLSICCGGGVLTIEQIKPAGSKEMSWQDFVNGRRVRPGDKFSNSEAQ